MGMALYLQWHIATPGLSKALSQATGYYSPSNAFKNTNTGSYVGIACHNVSIFH